MTSDQTKDVPGVEEQRRMTEEINQRIRARRKGTKDKTVSSVGKQDYGTPWDLISAMVRDFGVIRLDLAATEENSRCSAFISPEEDALSVDWVERLQLMAKSNTDFAYLNPPFERVRPWMEKCRDEAAKGARILSLTKASLDSNWYQDVVAPNAASWILKDRVKFVGCPHVFTQALMLTEWGTGKRGLGFWDWKR